MPDGGKDTSSREPTADEVAAAAARFADFARLVVGERERTGKSRYSQGEWSIYRNHFVSAPFADRRLQEVEERDIEEWVEASCKKKTRANTGTTRDSETINPETIKKHVSLCRQVFEAAGPNGYGLLLRNPVADYMQGRHHQQLLGSYAAPEKWDYLRPDEQEAIATCAAIPEDHRLIILFAIGTGIRQGVQFSVLKRHDLVVTGPRPHVRVPVDSDSKDPAVSGYREIPLLGPSLDAAKRWLELLKSGYGGSNPENVLFPFEKGGRRRNSGKPFAGDNTFARDLQKAGITREIRWIDLRHTCAVSMACGFFGGRRYSITEIATMLGTTTEAAAEYYNRYVENRITDRDAAERSYPSPTGEDLAGSSGSTVVRIATAHIDSVEVKRAARDERPTQLPSRPSNWNRSRVELCGEDARKQAAPMRLPPNAVLQAVSAIASGKHLLLVGPPGTGKTAFAQALVRAASDRGYCNGALVATASADWTTFDTIGGNSIARDGQLKFAPGIMPRAIESYRWLLIDEFNRADIDRAFGELMTVLSGHTVETGYVVDGRQVRIGSARDATHHVPQAFRVLATMNTWDKTSLFRLSFAVQRRFAIVDLGIPDDDAYADLIRRAAGELTEDSPRALEPALVERVVAFFSSENGLLKIRPIGPAIALDVVSYLRHRVPTTDDSLEAAAEALQMFVFPQLEGLMQNDAVRVHDLIVATLTGLPAPRRETLRERFFEVFPTLDRRLFTRERNARA